MFGRGLDSVVRSRQCGWGEVRMPTAAVMATEPDSARLVCSLDELDGRREQAALVPPCRVTVARSA